MSDFKLSVSEVAAKVKAARTDVADITALKNLAEPKDGTSFMVSKAIFIWVAGDVTPDDGISSLSRSGAPKSAPGRFRLPTLSIRGSRQA